MTDLILLLSIIFLLLISELIIKSTYKKYSIQETNLPLTGRDIAENMLRANDVNNVSIGYVQGSLTDHYNSKTKMINLAKASCGDNSVAAVAVAAHEVGHAIQDKNHYFMLVIRKILGPICVISSKFVWVAIFLGILFQHVGLIELGLILMGVTVLFEFVTLPVEFNASKRAVAYLSTIGYDNETMRAIKKMLKAAAFTYIASSLAALLQMIRMILRLKSDD